MTRFMMLVSLHHQARNEIGKLIYFIMKNAGLLKARVFLFFEFI